MTWTPTRTITDLATVVGSVDGRTWTNHGENGLVGVAATVRAELADALDTALASFDVTVSPYMPKHLDPPHIYIDADSPFVEPATMGRAGPKYLTWAYLVNVVISAKHHQASWDWFERIAPYIIDACYEVPGAMFHEMDAPDITDVNEGQQYLVAAGHVTVKRER